MSRRPVAGLDPKHEVVVGWDRPMQTFFGQVMDPSLAEEDEMIHWVGADRHGELPDVADLVRAMLPYADIGSDMQEKLRQDRAGNP